MRVRGTRETRGLHSLPNRTGPRTKAQMIAELAHLEHEKSMLERELELWASNRQKAEMRLETTKSRMDFLRRSLDESAGQQSSQDRQIPMGHSQAASQWREVTLEY